MKKIVAGFGARDSQIKKNMGETTLTIEQLERRMGKVGIDNRKALAE